MSDLIYLLWKVRKKEIVKQIGRDQVDQLLSQSDKNKEYPLKKGMIYVLRD